MSDLSDIIDSMEIPEIRKKLTRNNIRWILQHLKRISWEPASVLDDGLTKAELVEEIQKLDPDASTIGKKADLRARLTELRGPSNASADHKTVARLLLEALKGSKR